MLFFCSQPLHETFIMDYMPAKRDFAHHSFIVKVFEANNALFSAIFVEHLVCFPKNHTWEQLSVLLDQSLHLGFLALLLVSLEHLV